ncbi:MAG TPA: nicotinate phosphoribosyltransferase [Acidobacteriota bacterium]|nr:nicotinate phosphoribosyltransferase [Acidobacteriota bacterium]
MSASNNLIESTDLALFTDFYQLTMVQAYWEEGLQDKAVFDLFVRRLPEGRHYLLAAGLEDALEFLQNVRFDEDAIRYLDSLGTFSSRFLRALRDFRFQGDVYAVAEGTPVFADEPIVEVEAPIAQAQLVETFLMNQIHFQTLMASKAARVVEAARGRTLVDFGTRRMHGTDAALKAARAFHIAGVDATSNVAAGRRLDIPVSGTMAHSYIQAHDDEYSAFKAFCGVHPETILLVDTYDTLQGVRHVVRLAGELGEDFKVRGIRLDSGDLAELARQSRAILDRAGLQQVEIFASSSLDEQSIKELLDSGAPIDGFGVGTRMGVSADAPYLDIAYKLVGYAGKGRIKLSTSKKHLPSRKQVYRLEKGGKASYDVLALQEESSPGRPLLQPVMKSGRRLDSASPTLRDCRLRARGEIERLPARLRSLDALAEPYEVRVSDALKEARDALQQELEQKQHRHLPT